MKHLLFSCLLIVLYPPRGFAQQVDHTLETVVDIESGVIDSDDLPLLEMLRLSPLDINSADRTAWEQLPWIDAGTAQAIVDRRRANGPFQHIRGLIEVPGMDEDILNRIQPFITIIGASSRTGGRWRASDFRTGKNGVSGGGELGMQADINVYGRVSGGLRLDRRRSDRSYRLQAGYTEIRDGTKENRLIAGHFEADFGQGMTWRSRSARPSLSSFSASVKRRSRGLRPARTAYSTGRHRGLAGTYALRDFHVTGIAARDRAGTGTAGGRLSWSADQGVVGISAAFTDADRRIGLDADILFGRTNLFGELAFDRGHYAGLQAGLMWRAGQVEGGLVWHHEPNDYHTVDHTTVRNWSSLLLRWKPDRRTVIQLSIQPQKEGRRMRLKKTVRLRRRWYRGLTLSGIWHEESDRHPAGKGTVLSRRQGQAEWRWPRQVQWRGRLERRRAAAGADYTLLLSARYRSREKVNLTVQWQHTPAVGDGVPPSEVFRGRRSRWTLLLKGPVTSRCDVLMRYARTDQNRWLKTDLMESDLSMQVSMVW